MKPLDRRRWVGLAVALAVGTAGAGAGCNGTNGGGASAVPGAAAVCPATLADTIGGACAAPGLRCAPTFVCGILEVALSCVCDGHVFQCTDGAGAAVLTPDSLTCPGAQPAGSCPASERVAQLAPCKEQGLLCAYPSSCPHHFDQCQCFPGATAGGGFGLRFDCQTARCGGNGVVVDSGADAALAPDSTPAADAKSEADSPADADSAPPPDSGVEANSPMDSPSADESGDDAPASDASPSQ